MSLTHDQIQDIMGDVQDEFDSVSESKRRSITQSEESFVEWLRKKIKRAAKALGHAISLPVRIISDIIRSFLDGMFG